jgi:hypothetical protein
MLQKSKSSKSIARAIAQLEAAMAVLKPQITEPTEIGWGGLTLIIHPASEGERIDVCCGQNGHTTVNYTSEGVILDVYGGEKTGYELVRTAAIPIEDLQAESNTEGSADQADKTVTVIVEAHSTSDDAEGPDAVAILVNAAFFRRLQHMQLRVKSAGDGAQISARGSPESWFPKGIEDEQRFNHATIVHVDDGFWYQDSPKHASHFVESDIVDTASLLDVYAKAQHGATVVLGSDEFKEFIEDQLEPSAVVQEDAHGE